MIEDATCVGVGVIEVMYRVNVGLLWIEEMIGGVKGFVSEGDTG